MTIIKKTATLSDENPIFEIATCIDAAAANAFTGSVSVSIPRSSSPKEFQTFVKTMREIFSDLTTVNGKRRPYMLQAGDNSRTCTVSNLPNRLVNNIAEKIINRLQEYEMLNELQSTLMFAQLDITPKRREV